MSGYALHDEIGDRLSRVRMSERLWLRLGTASGRMDALVSAIAQQRTEDAHALAILISSELQDALQIAEAARL